MTSTLPLQRRFGSFGILHQAIKRFARLLYRW